MKLKNASKILMTKNTAEKNKALEILADKLLQNKELIFTENKKDVDNAVEMKLSPALTDRLVINEKRLNAMVEGVNEIIAQDDPVMTVEKGYKRPNGLLIHKVRVPLGVVGIIYESRPNVTVDAAALCIKSGNCAFLRGGKEARYSNTLLGKLISEALSEAGLPAECVKTVYDPDRNILHSMLKAKEYIDIIIPRGGEGLISYVTEHSLIPVVKHDKGLCHVYVDESADIDMAVDIAYNAKVQRPGVCNAMETLLLNKKIYREVLDKLMPEYEKAGVEVRASADIAEIYNTKHASEEDWRTEYLDLILSVKSVENMQEAIDHINQYGSMHSEAVVTSDYSRAMDFMNSVDASAVYVNASTRFTDGAEFGLGAEIGISTQKLHCRGPMGAYDLTTSKYMIYGHGHIKE
ncbi:glutamate-5-semialdehyde dehydrogenase [Flexistipes sp.]|uniref:glutamate-5-semialdehyde dehydrogenase n=1 Tax=Flexistipes sp. TaxID=3088135 RepID=UPI003FA60305